MLTGYSSTIAAVYPGIPALQIVGHFIGHSRRIAGGRGSDRMTELNVELNPYSLIWAAQWANNAFAAAAHRW